MSKSRKHKKVFACGNRGLGQWCHCCAGLHREDDRKNSDCRQGQPQPQQWRETFQQDSVDLRHLPKNIIVQARKKISFLEAGGNYRRLKGKRLRWNRTILSVPVTRNYRLLCKITSNTVIPIRVISHEEYNSIARNSRR